MKRAGTPGRSGARRGRPSRAPRQTPPAQRRRGREELSRRRQRRPGSPIRGSASPAATKAAERSSRSPSPRHAAGREEVPLPGGGGIVGGSSAGGRAPSGGAAT